MSALIYAMMQTYAVRENRLQQVTLNDFKRLMLKNIWKYFRLMLAIMFGFVLIALFMSLLAAFVSSWTLAVTIPLFLLFCLACIPLLMLVPTYIFERDITFTGAFKKAWKLGFATLGGMLGLIIVLFFLTYVIQTISTIPYYLLFFIGNIMSTLSESTMNQSVIYKFSIYLLGLIQAYGTYIASSIGIIGLAFQYFHAREKVEGVTIESNISNFSNM